MDYGNEISFSGSKREGTIFLWTNIFLLSLWVFVPLLSTLFICIFIGTCRLPRPVFLFYLFLLALVPAFINATKVPVTDLAEYNRIFDLYYNSGISAVPKESLADPLFYYTTWVLAHISGGYTPILIIFWSTGTYFVLFLALSEFDAMFVSAGKGRLAAILFFTLCVGVEFGLTGHLLRQCFAVSLVLLGLGRFVSGRKYKGIFLAAFLCHLSALIFLPTLLLVNLRKKRTRFVLLLVLFVAAIIVGETNLLEFASLLPGMNNQLAGGLLEKAGEYVNKNDGDITVRMMIEVVVYVVVSLYMAIFGIKAFSEKTNSAIRKYCLCVVTFSIFILFMRNNSLLLLRYFFYFQYLNLFLLIVLSRLKSMVFYGLFCLLIVTAPYRFFSLLGVSQYTYINNSYRLLFYSVPELLTHRL